MFRNTPILSQIGRTATSLIEDLGPSMVVMVATLAAGAWALGIRFETELHTTTQMW
ncbi:hypothetical protein ACQKKX_05720 [Neorhizobium sp. NPDC001467]|uniref:hypothetical protein n=1 Tax=Neorhizobium sp. NPDC001467 TaxID=3390595 RepID=UPI003CFF344F